MRKENKQLETSAKTRIVAQLHACSGQSSCIVKTTEHLDQVEKETHQIMTQTTGLMEKLNAAERAAARHLALKVGYRAVLAVIHELANNNKIHILAIDSGNDEAIDVPGRLQNLPGSTVEENNGSIMSVVRPMIIHYIDNSTQDLVELRFNLRSFVQLLSEIPNLMTGEQESTSGLGPSWLGGDKLISGMSSARLTNLIVQGEPYNFKAEKKPVSDLFNYGLICADEVQVKRHSLK